MKKEIVGCLCLILVFSATQGAAQTQPPGAPPQRTAPRPPAPAPAVSPYCLFEGKEYSIGAVLCVSSQMSQVCTATDTEHSRPWWSSGPQSLCAVARPEPPARSPALPSIPKADFPKSEP
jgi:hypothetical protein